MSVSTLESGNVRIGDGVTTVFDFAFEGRDALDIKVSYFVNNSLVPVESGFTVSLNPNNIGGNVTFVSPPANMQSFFIFRDTSATQLVSVSSQTRYDPKVVEGVWDKLTFLIQELLEMAARSVKTLPGLNADELIEDIFEAATEATTASSLALAGAPFRVPSFAALSRLVYSVPTGDQFIVAAGNVVDVPGVGAFEVLPLGAADEDFIAPGGVFMRVLPDAHGRYSVLQWGARNEGPAGFDNTAVFALITASMDRISDTTGGLTYSNRPILTFPPGPGFRTTATFEVTGWVNLLMESPILREAAASVAAIGIWLKNNLAAAFDGQRYNKSVLRVARITQGDWSQTNDIGVLADVQYGSQLEIAMVRGFRRSFDISAGYSDLYLGELRGGQESTISGRTTPSQFTNHMNIHGGSFVNGSENPGQSRYGLKIIGVLPSGVNTIRWYGPSFELNGPVAGAGENIPLICDGTTAGIKSVYVYDARGESMGDTMVRAIGSVRDVIFGLADNELEFLNSSSLMLDDQSTTGGVLKVYRNAGVHSGHMRSIFRTGRLATKYFNYTGSLAAVAGLDAATNAGIAPATQTFAIGGAQTATFDAAGHMTQGGVMRGIRIRLNGERALGILGTKRAGEDGSIALICFDSAGAQLRTTGTVRSEDSIPAFTDAYGGYFQAAIGPNDSATTQFQGVIHFSAAVATVFISVTAPTQSWEVMSLLGFAEAFSLSDNHPAPFAATAIPTAQIANAQAYPVGMAVWNANVAPAGVPGWVFTNAGTWKAMAAVAA